MRRTAKFLLLLMGIIFLAGCSGLQFPAADASQAETSAEYAWETSKLKDDPIWADPQSVKAMIISDLHYTEYKEVDPVLVPGIALAGEITDTIAAEVIDRHPDVLIMTGDNTNSGYIRDVAGLVPKLQKIKENGIPIIITTGNHDFDLMDSGEFEKAYFELLDPVDRDPASLSYTAIVKDVVFLAMDDNAVESGVGGEFSPETMRWISEMLAKYSGRPVIFLSHHNVLYGYGEEGSSSHLINNPELPKLLSDGGVRLALTGHMHFPYVTEMDGMWEILSGMPFSGKHLLGNLAVGADRLVYYAEPIDFAAYGGSTKEELERLDRESGEYMIWKERKSMGQKRKRSWGSLAGIWAITGQGLWRNMRRNCKRIPPTSSCSRGCGITITAHG